LWPDNIRTASAADGDAFDLKNAGGGRILARPRPPSEEFRINRCDFVE
jgi:hypothetical protein